MNDKPTGKWFTVWIQQSDGRGQTHISSWCADTMAAAIASAKDETCRDWGDDWTKERLRVLGVAEGDVEILHWEDYE